jgi:hypothetical protein
VYERKYGRKEVALEACVRVALTLTCKSDHSLPSRAGHLGQPQAQLHQPSLLSGWPVAVCRQGCTKTRLGGFPTSIRMNVNVVMAPNMAHFTSMWRRTHPFSLLVLPHSLCTRTHISPMHIHVPYVMVLMCFGCQKGHSACIQGKSERTVYVTLTFIFPCNPVCRLDIGGCRDRQCGAPHHADGAPRLQ